MRWRWLGARITGVAVVATLVLSACGSESANYVINDPAKLYFKVPKMWVVQGVNGDAFSSSDFLRDGAWARVFTPGDLDLETLDYTTTPGPIGTVVIGQVEQGEFDTLSIQRMRLLPYTDATGQTTALDPIEVLNSQDDEKVHLSLYQEEMRDGLRGVRIRYVMQLAPNTPAVVFDEVKFVHDATHTFYWFRVACGIECYLGYRQQIDSIFSSLRVREDQL
jgi:hypothetical protein